MDAAADDDDGVEVVVPVGGRWALLSMIARDADGEDPVPVVRVVLSVIAVDESHWTTLEVPRCTMICCLFVGNCLARSSK